MKLLQPPPMQSNPQETILAEGDVAGEAAGALASGSVLALEAAKTDPEIEIFRFTKLEDLPEGAVATCNSNFQTARSSAASKPCR